MYKKAITHAVGISLPSQLRAMSLAQVRRCDLTEIIEAEFVQRRKESKKVDFNWWRSRFHYHFRRENEKIPSDSTISRFLKRAQITLQRVRDHKAKTVEERLPEIRD